MAIFSTASQRRQRGANPNHEIDLPDDRTQDASGIGCRDGGGTEAILCCVNRSDGRILYALPDEVVRSVHQAVKQVSHHKRE
jgi:hypothetical protein